MCNDIHKSEPGWVTVIRLGIKLIYTTRNWVNSYNRIYLG